jgi:hypothetical protein
MSNKSIQKNIDIIMKQTTYTEEEALKKLEEFNNDVIKVVRDFMGINNNTNTNTKTIKSINQEIYKQIRTTLDSTMQSYRERNPLNLEQVVQNLTESEEKEKNKKIN